MHAQRVAKLEALLARVQTRAAESRSRRGSPALNVAPILRSRFEEDEVTGKVQAVTKSPYVPPPQVVPSAAKSAPKIAASPVAASPIVVDPPARVIAHESDAPEIEIISQKSTPKPEPVEAPLAFVEAPPALTPLGPPVHEPEVAAAKTASPAPVAVAKVADAKPVAMAKVAEAKPVVVAEAPAPRGRQFVVAFLLMLWILVVAAVVGLFFTGRLPMP
jgi:hypothetical protein